MMRRLVLFSLTAASLLGFSAAARAAEPPDDPPPVRHGLLSLLGFGRKTEKVDAEPARERSIKIDTAALVGREKLDYARRVEVCYRLRVIAIQNRDRGLEEQAI